MYFMNVLNEKWGGVSDRMEREWDGEGESGSHDDSKGDDAGKVGGDQLLYFLLTTSCLEINDWLIRVSYMCVLLQLLSEKLRRPTATNEGAQ